MSKTQRYMIAACLIATGCAPLLLYRTQPAFLFAGLGCMAAVWVFAFGLKLVQVRNRPSGRGGAGVGALISPLGGLTRPSNGKTTSVLQVVTAAVLLTLGALQAAGVIPADLDAASTAGIVGRLVMAVWENGSELLILLFGIFGYALRKPANG